MSEQFDLLVLGGGPGGYIAALKAAQLGAKVALVEQSHFGGTCLNNGCIPSKSLLASAEVLHTLGHAKTYGVTIDGEVGFDWKVIQKNKNRTLAKLRAGIKQLLNARNVTIFQGRGRLAGLGCCDVTDKKGEVTQVRAAKFILAMGSQVFRVPGWPDDADRICTSDEALHWKQLPSSLVIVGGGVIGCEFACMLQPMGVDVTIVEMMPRLLPEMDEELAGELQTIFAKRGITVCCGTKVDDVALTESGVSLNLSDGQALQADKMLVAIGRRPATDDCGLETVGIEPSPKGFIKVDGAMQTAVENYYCIGDANGRCLLAHAASAQGVTAAEHALGHAATGGQPIPWAVYTFPEVAGVGLTEAAAVADELTVAVGKFPMGHLGKAMAANHTDGFVKVIRHAETDAILGVHILGHNATELIHAAAMMIGQQATATELAEAIFAHPTLSEAIKEAAEDSLGIALHLPPKA